MNRSTRQALILAGLLTALAIVIYVQFFSGPAAPPSAPSNPVAAASRPATRGTGNAQAAGGASEPVTNVRLELLDSSVDPLDEARRNPFRFQVRAAPAPPPRPAASPDAVDNLPPPVPSGPPPPAPILLRFIGVVELPPPEGRMAILSDGRGGLPVPGKEGDIIEGRYRLIRVGADSIEMAYLDGRGRQTIRLSGQ